MSRCTIPVAYISVLLDHANLIVKGRVPGQRFYDCHCPVVAVNVDCRLKDIGSIVF